MSLNVVPPDDLRLYNDKRAVAPSVNHAGASAKVGITRIRSPLQLVCCPWGKAITSSPSVPVPPAGPVVGSGPHPAPLTSFRPSVRPPTTTDIPSPSKPLPESVTWFPIGVSRTYGFRSAKEVFTGRNNTTGFSDAWAWVLSFYYAGTRLRGETKNASTTSARGIFWSGFASAVLALVATIVWLFCRSIGAASIGRGGAVVTTVIAVLGLILSTTCAVTASSRLIFAIARDGILPGSRWIAKPSPQGQPRNAVTIILVISTLLLIISTGSQVAFTSLLSAGATSMSSR
ncbi:hypothetical protein EHS25_001712 [Saitozyma podzolica]|uniref:Amino acid permease/ SLC12A domain-containing protein n=1 Tax=Saitozyma podzolica TaxID=1890683 RepID=A0A427YFH2_9TREE|nr:hypothetical protein EHS25_001712 [Saitozyma podzolica]